jgi:hypothetical protein
MVIGEYTPPGGKPPCCAGCASPAERRALQRTGAAMVAGMSRGRRGGLRGEELGGPLVWTPGQIENLADQTNTEIWALARDYSKGIASGAINHAQLASFKAYFNEWEGFYGTLKAWYARVPFVGPLLWGGTVDRVEEYRTRLVGWRNLLISVGGRPSAPAPVLPPKGDGGAPATVKWIAGAAIVVGGAYALGKVAGFIPKFRSA